MNLRRPRFPLRRPPRLDRPPCGLDDTLPTSRTATWRDLGALCAAKMAKWDALTRRQRLGYEKIWDKNYRSMPR